MLRETEEPRITPWVPAPAAEYGIVQLCALRLCGPDLQMSVKTWYCPEMLVRDLLGKEARQIIKFLSLVL